jgi:hypothetical protein
MPSLRIPTDPIRTPRVCPLGLHKILLIPTSGNFSEWDVNNDEFEFWNGLTVDEQNSLIERQYTDCFLCYLDTLKRNKSPIV